MNILIAFLFIISFVSPPLSKYAHPLAELRQICTLSYRSVARHCGRISPLLPADIPVLAYRYLRLYPQISLLMAFHDPINSANGLRSSFTTYRRLSWTAERPRLPFLHFSCSDTAEHLQHYCKALAATLQNGCSGMNLAMPNILLSTHHHFLADTTSSYSGIWRRTKIHKDASK